MNVRRAKCATIFSKFFFFGNEEIFFIRIYSNAIINIYNFIIPTQIGIIFYNAFYLYFFIAGIIKKIIKKLWP